MNLKNNSLEIRLRTITEEYEQKLQEQKADYKGKLKFLTTNMNSQLEEKEKQFNRQIQDFIGKTAFIFDEIIS